MTNTIDLNSYYTRKGSHTDNTDLVSNINGPDISSHPGLMTPEQKTKLDNTETSITNISNQLASYGEKEITVNYINGTSDTLTLIIKEQ